MTSSSDFKSVREILINRFQNNPDFVRLFVPKVDEYGQAINCVENASWINQQLLKGKSVAIPLSLGDGFTMFYVSFVPLLFAIPLNISYNDGSNKGIQINIDRRGSYALPMNTQIEEEGYLAEKLQIGLPDARLLLPFINNILKGGDSNEL